MLFPSFGGDVQVRSFPESVKVKLLASLVDSDSQITKNPSTKSKRFAGSSLETDSELWKTGRVVPPPRGAEQAASMMRCPPCGEYMSANNNDSEALVKRTTFVPPDPGFAAVPEQLGWSHLAGTMVSRAIDVCQSDGVGVRG